MNRLTHLVPDLPLSELRIKPADAPALAPQRWVHYRTDCVTRTSATAGAEGMTAWVWTEGTRRAVIAWEWIELSMGVLVLADPNALMSNLMFTGSMQGMERVDPRSRNVLMLNTIVHGLPWQERVLCQLRGQLPGGAVASALIQPALH